MLDVPPLNRVPAFTVHQAFNLALQRHRAGQLAEAEALYRQILAVQPNHPDALHFLGVIAHQTGNHVLALDLIQKSLVLRPDNGTALSNLGEALRALERWEEAIASYRSALRLNPEKAGTYYNLGIALQAQGQFADAVAAYRQAIQIQPAYSAASHNLGSLLHLQGEIEDAIACYEQALRAQPECAPALSNLILTLHFRPGDVTPRIRELQHHWNRQLGQPQKSFIPPHDNDPSPDRRLRVGYVSPDFCDHAVGRNLLPLFRHHDSRLFEITCYSGVLHPDPVTDEFRRLAYHWHSTIGVSDEALAALIRQDNIDLLVDLSQHTACNRLTVFPRHPAPVQLSFAGYPESAGIEAIPNRLSDRWLESADTAEPEVRHSSFVIRHSEHLFLLDSFWCYDPCGPDIEVNALPAEANPFITFGNLTNSSKINEPLLRLWARILHAVPSSRLLLLCDLESQRHWIRGIFQEENIIADRLEFLSRLPRPDYLRAYHRLDIVLDPFPYGGHTTGLDALWMGVPFVSLAGDRPVSRAGLSQLSNLGLRELVALSTDEYITIAAALAHDLPRLAELRRTLRSRMQSSPLMDAPNFARGIESAYRSLWRQWCANWMLGVGC